MTPLWLPTTATVESERFGLAPGYVALFYAVGFEPYRNAAPTDQVRMEQKACLQRIITNYETPQAAICTPCAVYPPQNEVPDFEFVIDIEGAGCDWSVSMCRNFAILGVPGYWQFVLNDPEAVGVANIYMDVVETGAIPVQLAASFFGGN